MPTRPHHRKLTDHLAGWDAARIARLLQRRPDLAHPSPPHEIAELARRAQQQPSVSAAITAVTLPENRLLQLVVCCRPNLPLDELAAVLPDGVGLDDIEATLVALEDAALVWRHGGRVHCSGTLRQAMPTTLGPPLQALVKGMTVDYLKHAVSSLRAAAEDGRYEAPLPPRATKPGSRPPRKAELVDDLEALLVAPGLVAAALRSGPPECAEIAAAMAQGRPAIEVGSPLYFSRHRGPAYYRGDPTYWLYERALLLPGPGGDGVALQPREVGVSLRGGRPVADLALERPTFVTGDADPPAVDTQAATRAARTVHLLSDLVDLWSADPAKALKGGGLGARAMKPVAAALEVDLDEAGRTVELAHLAGLVDSTLVSRKDGRRNVHDTVVGPTAAAAAWVERPLARRWAQLAAAWLRAEHWPSASGRPLGDGDGKPAPVLSYQNAANAPARRRDVLDLLGMLEPGSSTSPEALASSVYWRCPQPWLGVGGVDPATAIGWVYAEAELLGLAAGGALSSFGRELIAGQGTRAERAFDAALPAQVETFTLQADLTATVLGELDRDTLVELRLLADVESTGAATTLRFSEASLRRAIDAGRDGDAILAFLEAHAAKGVPPALAYLVNDVARRHGHLQVGVAGSFVTSDDPAVLADACSHRRTRKLGLRLLAPTVAASPQPPAKLLDGLRAAGFLPVADGESPGGVELAAGTGGPAATSTPAGDRPPYGDRAGAGRASEGAAAKRAAATDSLPEPFRARSRIGGVPQAIDGAAALALAEQVLAGRASESTSTTSPQQRRVSGRAHDLQPRLPMTVTGAIDAEDLDDLQIVVIDGDGGGFVRRGGRAGDGGSGVDDIDIDEIDGIDMAFGEDDLGEVDTLDELLASASTNGSVIAVAMGEGDELADPVLLAVTGWEPGRVVGIDLAEGATTSILTEHIGAAVEVGRADAIAHLGTPGRSRRSTRRRSSRGRRR